MDRLKENLYSYNIAVVTKYNESLYRVVNHRTLRNSGVEAPDEEEDKEDSNEYDFKLDNSISRSKRMIREYALCNPWEYFITLTLDAEKIDRYDLDNYINRLGKWLRNRYSRNGHNIKYLLVPEKHQDGAWHIHGLISGIPPGEISPNEYGYLDWRAYRDKFGWCSLDYIKDKNKIANYIVKYVSKDLAIDRAKYKKLYYNSRGLEKAQIIEKRTLSPDSSFSPTFENDFCQIAEYSSLEEVQALFDDVIISVNTIKNKLANDRPKNSKVQAQGYQYLSLGYNI